MAGGVADLLQDMPGYLGALRDIEREPYERRRLEDEELRRKLERQETQQNILRKALELSYERDVYDARVKGAKLEPDKTQAEIDLRTRQAYQAGKAGDLAAQRGYDILEKRPLDMEAKRQQISESQARVQQLNRTGMSTSAGVRERITQLQQHMRNQPRDSWDPILSQIQDLEKLYDVLVDQESRKGRRVPGSTKGLPTFKQKTTIQGNIANHQRYSDLIDDAFGYISNDTVGMWGIYTRGKEAVESFYNETIGINEQYKKDMESGDPERQAHAAAMIQEHMPATQFAQLIYELQTGTWKEIVGPGGLTKADRQHIDKNIRGLAAADSPDAARLSLYRIQARFRAAQERAEKSLLEAEAKATDKTAKRGEAPPLEDRVPGQTVVEHKGVRYLWQEGGWETLDNPMGVRGGR